MEAENLNKFRLDPVEPSPAESVYNKPDYMAGVNRILTSLLSGLIGSALLLFGLYFGAQWFGEDLGIEGQFSIQFLLLSLLVIFVSMLLTQIIQTYLYKLIEKNVYNKVAPGIYANLLSQLILLVIVFPFIFIFLSFSKTAVALVFAFYFVFSLIISAANRESGFSERLIGNLTGLFLGALISMFIFFSLGEVKVLLSVVVLPLALICGAIFELLADVLVHFIKRA